MVLPVADRNAVMREAKTCMVEEGRDPEECIIEAAKNHNLSRRQAQEIADEIMDDADEE